LYLVTWFSVHIGFQRLHHPMVWVSRIECSLRLPTPGERVPSAPSSEHILAPLIASVNFMFPATALFAWWIWWRFRSPSLVSPTPSKSYQLAFFTPGKYPFNAFIRNWYCSEMLACTSTSLALPEYILATSESL
jgi:hypothetical protein